MMLCVNESRLGGVFVWEKGAPASLPPRGTTRGLRLLPSQPHHAEGHFDCSGHDDSSTMGACTVVEHRRRGP
jgi:hypothetical protein